MRDRIDAPPDLGSPSDPAPAPVPAPEPVVIQVTGPPGPPGQPPTWLLTGMAVVLFLNLALIGATGSVLRHLPAPAPAPAPAPGPKPVPTPTPAPEPPTPGPPAPVPSGSIDAQVRSAAAAYFGRYPARYAADAKAVAAGGASYAALRKARIAERDALGKALGEAVDAVVFPAVGPDGDSFKDPAAGSAALRTVADSLAAGVADAAAGSDTRSVGKRP